jgi:hypothetical protein
MTRAALGFRVHSGWTALVALGVEKGQPCVLHRQRPHLVETFTFEFRQPYHTAERMPYAKAAAFLAKAQAEAQHLAHEALRAVQADLEKQGCALASCALLLSSGRALPSLEKILASHALIHTADGELFREALRHAAQRSRLPVFPIREHDLLEQASRTLRLSSAALTARLTALGKPLGSPWTQDEKFAALAAWLALSPQKKS